jgi:hypothetical protein
LRLASPGSCGCILYLVPLVCRSREVWMLNNSYACDLQITERWCFHSVMQQRLYGKWLMDHL